MPPPELVPVRRNAASTSTSTSSVSAGASVEFADEGLGEPLGAIWDVAIIEAALASAGQRVELRALVQG